MTAELDGYIADTATTVVLPGGSDAGGRLRNCAISAFQAGCAVARAGQRVAEIGRAVEKVVTEEGFYVVRQVSGHGVGHAIHEPPTIPNYCDPFQRDVLTEGLNLVVTVEPTLPSAVRASPRMTMAGRCARRLAASRRQPPMQSGLAHRRDIPKLPCSGHSRNCGD